ncbi:aldo/keto reductase [Actinomadura rudentiformis]|uniref:Aldo/keto reductase n=1 Tax=Actinomadura rudentiformis TaxID=359158 RepID=A0A6H9YRW9_9ACTN|nr:aldo/keto reductase [Actinomadura rudentiformis]KAB2344503.1 aldo/keto reductase [Actinomadura rudentiformis]
MQVRKLGDAGLASSVIGLGTLALTGRSGPVDDAASVDTIRFALDIGVTLIDAATGCEAERAERLVGRAVAGRRDEAMIAVGGGSRPDAGGRRRRLDGTPEHLRRSCEASLARLGVDHIDLYYLDGVDPGVPLEDSMGELAELVAAGKVRHVGMSGASADQLRRAHAVHPVAALAAEYSLWERRVEAECLPAARERGIAVFACRPLGRGFLTGRIRSADQLSADDIRHDDPRFWPENLPANLDLLRAAEEIAAQRDLGLPRLAIAWLLGRGDDITPVPSTRDRVHLEMNSAAAGVRLTPDECDHLAALFPPASVAGRGRTLP